MGDSFSHRVLMLQVPNLRVGVREPVAGHLDDEQALFGYVLHLPDLAVPAIVDEAQKAVLPKVNGNALSHTGTLHSRNSGSAFPAVQQSPNVNGAAPVGNRGGFGAGIPWHVLATTACDESTLPLPSSMRTEAGRRRGGSNGQLVANVPDTGLHESEVSGQDPVLVGSHLAAKNGRVVVDGHVDRRELPDSYAAIQQPR